MRRLKYLYLAYFSKPVSDRALYRAIRRRGVRTIVEIGMGTGQRALRLIELASQAKSDKAVRYVAVDLFEARSPQDGPGLPLKEAHRLLKASGAQVQLIPGDPHSALARSANSLQNTDLVIISAGHDEQSLASAWFYLPRMLHAGSAVYVESKTGEASQSTLELLSPVEIEAKARSARGKRAA